jgi:predicted membrane-bound spermidine synthase
MVNPYTALSVVALISAFSPRVGFACWGFNAMRLHWSFIAGPAMLGILIGVAIGFRAGAELCLP